MKTNEDAQTELDSLIAREAAIIAREAALFEALEDALAERAEVLAFARDVRQRLTRHPEAASDEFEAHLGRIDRIHLPEVDARIVSKRIRMLREEAARAREALSDAVDHELTGSLDAIDLALETVRDARDFMLRHRHRRASLMMATVPAPRPSEGVEDDATVVMAAVSGLNTRPPATGSESTRAPRIGRSALDDIPGPAAVRQTKRRGLETRIDFYSASNFFSGFSSNISDGGLFIATDHDVALGTEIDIRFTLPHGMQVECAAIVRWRRAASDDLAAGLGVEFVGLADKARDAVQRFMKQREPIFHEE